MLHNPIYSKFVHSRSHSDVNSFILSSRIIVHSFGRHDLAKWCLDAEKPSRVALCVDPVDVSQLGRHARDGHCVAQACELLPP